MSSTGAIPRTKKMIAITPVASTLHPDTQILVGQEASEPLDIKLITMSANGVQTRVPALHKSWCCARELMHYLPPPNEGLELPGALDAWLEQMDFFRQDLEWMLELPHHRFWSELVFEHKVHDCLVSYLSQAPRWYDECPNIAEQHHNTVAPVLASLHRLVLLVHVRMATYKESKTCHISPSAFGNLVYQNYILDVCQLLDLCALYCPANRALLTKMVNNVFSAEPRYLHDLEEVLTSIGTALDNVEHRLGVSESSVPQSLHSAAHSSGAGLDDLLAIVYYLLDTCYTLHNLVLVHPPAARNLHKNDLHIRLAVCYERVMPSLSQRLCQHRHPAMDGDPNGVKRALARLQQLRVTTLAAFRVATEAVCLAPLQRDGVSGHVISECLEAYLHVVSSCLGEKTFITDYHTTFSFTKDITIFKDLSSDATSLQFIEEAVKTVLEETGVTDQPPPPSLTNGHGPKGTESQAGDSSGMSLYVASGSAEVDAVQLAELVSTVHELLPELGAGFITKCLKHFRYSTEAVINAVLEDSLPADLAVLDRSLASADLPSQQMEIAAPASTAPARVTGADASYGNSYEQAVDEAKLSVMNRANIYNDDEFDVFSSNRVDTTKVHRGKKKKEVSETDEAVNERVRTLGHQYEERAGRSIYEDEYEPGHVSEEDDDLLPDADYNDEYDDTYDDNEAGNLDANTEIMMPSRKLNFKARPTIFGRGSLNAPLANGLGGSDEEEETISDNGPGPVGRSLPTEENEEEFGRRRGLRKGVGGVEFMLELRDSGGVIQNKPLQYERNLPASHNSTNNQKKRSQRRHLPRDYHRDHHRPMQVNAGGGSQQDTDDVSEENSAMAVGGLQEEDEQDDSSAGPRLSFTPFCEDPAVVRQRQANTWASRDAARNRGGNRGRRQQGNMPPPQPMPVGSLDGTSHPSAEGAVGGSNSYMGGVMQSQAEGALGGSSFRGGTRPKTFTNKSGKSWRQGTDDEARGSKGGKWKEDTNHGSAQDPNFRRKMENKNKARKQAAQNKFNKNN